MFETSPAIKPGTGQLVFPSTRLAPVASLPYHIEPIPLSWDPLRLVRAAGAGGALLDSGPGYGAFGRFSFFGCEPFLTVSARGASVRIVGEHRRQLMSGNPVEILSRLIREQTLPVDAPASHASHLPFRTGAAIGFLSYELGRFMEPFARRSKEEPGLPDLQFFFFDALLAHDHSMNQTWAIVRNQPEAGKRLQSTLDRIKRAGLEGSRLHSSRQPSSETWTSSLTYEDYSAAVTKAQRYITDGEIYQVNLSQQLWCRCSMTAPQLYRQLRQTGASPFGAYLQGKGWAVLSLSPERFLRYWPGQRRIQTRPIKGTRPRGASSEEDQELRQSLLQSPKDAAEHVMIVDLERNDLGRLARYGTVRVSDFRRLETFPTVHHLTSTVEATLRPNCSLEDLLQATFPGGSITGTPKVRAMQVIDELEPRSRGLYTGSIGYLAFDGNLDLNIAIRTLVLRDGWARYSTGGAIVADSRAEDEYLETLHKARPFLRALDLGEPSRHGLKTPVR